MNNLKRMILRMKKLSNRKEVNKTIVKIVNKVRVMMVQMKIATKKNQAVASPLSSQRIMQ